MRTKNLGKLPARRRGEQAHSPPGGIGHRRELLRNRRHQCRPGFPAHHHSTYGPRQLASTCSSTGVCRAASLAIRATGNRTWLSTAWSSLAVVAYRPRFSADRVLDLTRWHERAYRELKAAGEVRLSYLGLEVVIPPGVFSPTPTSDLLGRAVLTEVRPTDRVLDMGTGSGVNAILAATVANDVVGVDVNPAAVAVARVNAARNGVRAAFAVSDVFSAVEGAFDLVVIDPHFRWFSPRDLLEAAIHRRGLLSPRAVLRRAQFAAPSRRPGPTLLRHLRRPGACPQSGDGCRSSSRSPRLSGADEGREHCHVLHVPAECLTSTASGTALSPTVRSSVVARHAWPRRSCRCVPSGDVLVGQVQWVLPLHGRPVHVGHSWPVVAL